MIYIIYGLFITTLFMPSLNISKIAISDIFMLILLLNLLKNIKLNKMSKQIIFYFLFFILIYFLEEIIHLYYLTSNSIEYKIIPDKVAFLYYFIIILIFILLGNSKKIKQEKIIKITFFSIILNAMILPFFFLILSAGKYEKLTSLFVKPNQLAFFLILAPIILIIFDNLKNKKLKNLGKINLLIFILYIPMFATASKSGLMILFFIHIIIFIYLYPLLNKISKIFFIFIFSLLLLIINPIILQSFIDNYLINYFPQFSRVATFLFAEHIQTEDSFRIINNKEGLEIFYNFPLFGLGFGSDIVLTNTHHEIHNTYIRLLSCIGLIGSLFFYTLHFYIVFLSLKIYKNFIFIILFIVVSIYGIYHDIYTSKYFYIFMGILIYSYISMRNKEKIVKTDTSILSREKGK